MLTTSDLRKGLKIALDGELYMVVDFQHSKLARRGANVWLKLKNLRTGAVLEKTVSGGATFEEPDFEEKELQFLYADDDGFHFMDGETYEQVAIPKEVVGDTRDFLIEGSNYLVLFFEKRPISIELPTSVVLEVTETEPAVRGDSVTNIMKPARLETGLEVKVPLFIKEGDLVKVDTRTRTYIERVSSRE